MLRVKSVLRLKRPKPLAAISYWSPHAEEGPLLSDYQKGLRGLPFVGISLDFISRFPIFNCIENQ